ncbi:lipopolysaccharide biosynthesis protein [Prevotella sp.]|uniref:lipopolysaccharide biosynthesis protein n=1 Tax=Prevotella sp. TaxID=59823 RepID=UPI003AB60D1D
MTDTAQNNKRIAKNTLLLYARMLFLMVISLYTSRVILNTLGVEDYGINNVVSGFIGMLGFLSGSLGAASSRFITYDLGIGDMPTMKRTFGNIVTIHLLLAVIILILGETIGLWFVLNKLQIPENRMTAALWVYQFSIFSFMLSIVSVPYNATIIAHERMKAFAYISIVDALLKLLIVYLLVVIPYDKLIIYAILFFCIQVFDRVVYGVYCYRHFEETKTKLAFNKKLFKEIFSFAVWTMNGNLAVIGYTQGINVLLNMFFGPIVNAARGVAVQVQTVVQNFCNNFQMALNPQLTKSYAQNDLEHMQQLLKVSSKFSFFLLYIISLPLMLEAPLVLKWWLGIIPEHTVNFLRLILCSSMLIALSNPLIVSVHATGKIKKFQAIEGTMLLCIVPIAYVLLKFFDIRPEYVFCVHIIVEILTQYVRVRIILPMISMKCIDYFKEVIVPIIKVIIITPILPLIAYHYINQSVITFFLICFISVISVLVGVYYWGCLKSEREFIINKIRQKISKRNG